MKIVGLQVSNFKRLKAVELTPDGTSVVIAGRNAQGKSSVLDAIWAALAGKSGVKEITRPIRDGESKASVVVELDDLRVERKWTPSGSTLTVGPRDGKSKFNSPQAILDNLIGKLAFDPLAFAEADAKTQRAMLLTLTGLDEAVAAIDARRKHNYDGRTEVNREVKRVRAEVESRADAREVEPVDVAAVVDELRIAEEKERLRARHSRLLEQIKALEAELEDVATQGRALPGTRTASVIANELAETGETNRQAQRWIDRKAAEALLAEVEKASADLTEAIEADDRAKVDLLATAKLPVEGLGVDDDGVTFNGVPFIQASAAERLRVSVAMAMAANPEVRVICIKDASLLDSDSRKLLADMAAEHDYQIWYEVVGDGGPTGVVIEDGEVANG